MDVYLDADYYFDVFSMEPLKLCRAVFDWFYLVSFTQTADALGYLLTGINSCRSELSLAIMVGGKF